MKKNSNTTSNKKITPTSADINGFSEFIYESAEQQDFDEFLRESPDTHNKRKKEEKRRPKNSDLHYWVFCIFQL